MSQVAALLLMYFEEEVNINFFNLFFYLIKYIRQLPNLHIFKYIKCYINTFFQDAFWALHTLMCDESHAMHGFFVPGFPKLLRFQQHHDKVLKKMLPKLKKHLVNFSLYILKCSPF